MFSLELPSQGDSLRPPRCVSTGPVVVRLAGMANERERELRRATSVMGFWALSMCDMLINPDLEATPSRSTFTV